MSSFRKNYDYSVVLVPDDKNYLFGQWRVYEPIPEIQGIASPSLVHFPGDQMDAALTFLKEYHSADGMVHGKWQNPKLARICFWSRNKLEVGAFVFRRGTKAISNPPFEMIEIPNGHVHNRVVNHLTTGVHAMSRSDGRFPLVHMKIQNSSVKWEYGDWEEIEVMPSFEFYSKFQNMTLATTNDVKHLLSFFTQGPGLKYCPRKEYSGRGKITDAAYEADVVGVLSRPNSADKLYQLCNPIP